MRRLLEGMEDVDDDASLLESFQNATSEDRVYVLTPQGEVKDLAAGATPLDFAYLVHTEVGHRCRGARINGRIVPLTTTLSNGDRVEILTAKEPRPSRDWLSPRLGYIRTARARAKVRHWFKQANYEDNLAAGRHAVESEFRRLDLSLTDLDSVLATFNFHRVDDLLVAVGSGDLTAGQIAGAIERQHAAQRPPPDQLTVHQNRPSRGDSDDIRIEGIGKLLYPDGALLSAGTRRSDWRLYHPRARNQHSPAGLPPVSQPVSRSTPSGYLTSNWADRARGNYPAQIVLEAWDRRDLIRDLGTLLAHENVNVSAMNAAHDDKSQQVRIELTVQVDGLRPAGRVAGENAIHPQRHQRAPPAQSIR